MEKVSLQQALAGHQRVSEIARRTMFEPEAIRAGNDNTLWKTMESGIRVLSRRYAATDHPIELFEPEIRDVWYMFTLAAQHIEAHHPAQDRLLRIILCARNRGVLQRAAENETTIVAEEANPTPTKNEGQAAETSQGRIWVDLPFLVQDVRDAWKTLMESSAPFVQCCNLTAAIARLAGLGICGHAFSQCGLEIMKQALETPPTSSSTPSELKRSGEYLVLVEIWLLYAREDLFQLCLAASTYSDPSWALGEQQSVRLLVGEVRIEESASAYSLERFTRWKDRLAAMRAEVQDETSVEARCAYMINGVWDDYFGILYRSG